jgi:zinc protease
MRPVSASRVLSIFLLASIAACGGSSETTAPSTPAAAPPKAAAEPAAAGLPAAEAVLDAYVEATGGRAAYEKLDTRVTTGTFMLSRVNEGGKFVMYQSAPNRMYLSIEMPRMGKEERGTDGQVAWSKSGMTGNRMIEGEERAQLMRTAALRGDLDWRQLYKKVENLGVEEVGGRKTYKIALHTPEGSVEHRYYDVETKLLHRTTLVEKSPMGEVPVESLASDYRKVGDLVVPHKAIIKAMSMEQVLTLEKIEHNVPIDAKKFEVPADVKAAPSAPAKK